MSRKEAVLSYEWPEQNVQTNTTEEYRYYFADRRKRDVPVDHITSHIDGTFHIKTSHDRPAYVHRMRRTEPLGVNTNVFLECIVVSDIAGDYRTDTRKLQPGSVVFAVPLGSGLRMHMAFAGREYPLESQFAHAPQYVQVQRQITLGSFRAVFVASFHRPDVEMASHRTRGTLISFRFPLTTGNDRLKNFIFA